MSDVIDVIEPARGLVVPADADAFLAGLRAPTIVHVAGRDRSRARVVAGSLHGNEPSGLRAIHRVLADRIEPAVDTWFFLGAVEAAQAPPGFAHRMLPGRRDLNRCFRPPFDDRDGAIAQAALMRLRAVAPELVVDLHNNTGHNPAYAVGPSTDGAYLGLTALFARTFVHSRLSLGTFSEAFADLAPSVAIECGRAGDPAADATAHAGLLRLLRLEHPGALVVSEPLAILVDPMRVQLQPWASLAFATAPVADAQLTLVPDVDRHNFQTLAPGTALGWLQGPWPLLAIDEHGRERAHELLLDDGGVLRTRTTIVPMMATTDVAAARGDCLFYAASRQQ